MKLFNLLCFFYIIILFISYKLVNDREKCMTELMLANVEALASGETLKQDCPLYGNGCYNVLWWPSKRESGL